MVTLYVYVCGNKSYRLQISDVPLPPLPVKHASSLLSHWHLAFLVEWHKIQGWNQGQSNIG